MTVSEILIRAREELGGVSRTPELDAVWIMTEVLGVEDSSYLVAHGEEEVSPTQAARYLKLLGRRVQGEPLAYVLGWWEFYGRKFKVTKDVLVPRPATEELVEKTIVKIDKLNKSLGRSVMVADIGTGSGCVAITLLLERDNIEMLATDISEAALNVAKENAKRHGVTERIKFLSGDMLEPLQGLAVDLVVSNPPYVPSAEIDRAASSPTAETAGLAFEPRAALDGGNDGLNMVRTLQNQGLPYIVETVGGKIMEG